MSISFSGLASGLDTSSWVESLVALKKAKVTSLEEEKETTALTKETLANIKSFFSSFRSVLEKVTDTKFGIANMDLFAQNLANSSNIDILTASATTEAQEATYKISVDKLATNTEALSNYVTTYEQKTLAGMDSKLTSLGVSINADTGSNIGVLINGVERGVHLTQNDTIATFINKLNDIGVEASFNTSTGIFSLNVSGSDINDIDGTGIAEAFHLTGVNEGYESGTLKTTRTDTVYVAATSSDTIYSIAAAKTETRDGQAVHQGDNLKTLLENGNVQVTVRANGTDSVFTISQSTTMADFVADLNSKNIEAELDATGVFTITDAEIITHEPPAGSIDSGQALLDAFGMSVDIYSKAQASTALNHAQTIVELAKYDTKLSSVGVSFSNAASENTIKIVNSDNETVQVQLTENTTIGGLIEVLSNNGLYAAINQDGTLEIAGGKVSGRIITELGLNEEPYTAMVTGKALVETVVVQKTVDLDTRLVNDLRVSKGYLEVTKPDGTKYYEKIYSGQTIADFMADMGNLGINTSLSDDGILTITGGAFKTLSDIDVEDLISRGAIIENDEDYQKGTNLLECLYGADEIEPNHISISSTRAKSRALTHSVTNTIQADWSTKLTSLGLAETDGVVGTAEFTVRDEVRTINLSTTDDIDSLIDKLEAAGIAASFDEDTHRLTINNATLTGGSSNLGEVLDLTTSIAGKYKTSNQLYAQTTITIDATRETLLGDYGITSSMNNSQRTVTIYNSEGTALSATIVSENTSIGDLLDFINSQDGVSASIENGIITVHNGYITNEALETAMGLETSNKTSYVLGSIMTTTSMTAVTGDTTLGDIISSLRTTEAVSGGYNLSFNSQNIEVNADTTINQLIDKIYAAGGTAVLDSTGRLSINGGTLEGTVATALGVTSTTHTLSVSADGEYLHTKQEVYADRDTKLSDLGITNSSYIIHDRLGNAISTINVTGNDTIGSVLDTLRTNGINGVIADGIVALDSAEGKYITGGVADAFGITYSTVTEVVNTTSSSTLSITHTGTITATTSTTLGEIGAVTGSGQVINIFDSSQNQIGTITNLTTSSTIGDMFAELESWGIQGSITDGVINLFSAEGRYATGSILANIGINVENGIGNTLTIAQTITSASPIQLTDTVKANEADKISDFITLPANKNIVVKNSDNTDLTTIAVNNSTTFGNLFSQLSAYGIDGDIHDGVIALTSSNGNYVTGDILGELGITLTPTTITTTSGITSTSTADITYTQTVNADETDRIQDFLGFAINNTNNAIVVHSTDGAELGTVNVTSETTFEELFEALSAYNIDGDIHNGTVILTSAQSNYITGTIPSTLGINVGSSTVTITHGINTTSSNPVTYTHNVNATEDDKISDYITLPANKNIVVKNSDNTDLTTIAIDNSTTFGNLFSQLSAYGIDGDIHDGVIALTSSNGNYATGDVLSTMSINLTPTTVTTGIAVTSSGPISYSETVNAKETDRIQDFVDSAINAINGSIVVHSTDGAELGHFVVNNTTTFEELFETLSSYGIDGDIHNGTIILTSPESNYIIGSVAAALGINVGTSTITVTTGATTTSTASVQYTSTVKATETDKISDFVTIDLSQTSNRAIEIHSADGALVTSTSFNQNATFEELFGILSEYGIDGDIHDGKVIFTSTDGNYVSGNVIDTLGMQAIPTTVTQTVGMSSTSTAPISYTDTIRAKNTDKIRDYLSFDITGENSTIQVRSTDGTCFGNINISNSTTFDDLFTSLNTYGIDGAVYDGTVVLTSALGNYITGNVPTALGINVGSSTITVTTGASVTSSAAVTYTTKITETDKISDVVSIPVTPTITVFNSDGTQAGTISVNNNTTFENLFGSLSEYGIDGDIHDGRIILTSSNGAYALGGVFDTLGISAQSSETTHTIGQTVSVASGLTYSVIQVATEDSLIGDYISLSATASDNTITVYYPKNNSTVSVSATITVDSTTTFGGLFNELSRYNIDGDIHNGYVMLSSSSHAYATGSIMDKLNIGTSIISSGTSTVGLTITSSTPVTYTHASTVAATGSDIISNSLGYYFTATIAFTNGATVTATSTTTTFDELSGKLSGWGISSHMEDGKFVVDYNPGCTVRIDATVGLGAALGLTVAPQQTVTTTVGATATSNAAITYNVETLASGSTTMEDMGILSSDGLIYNVDRMTAAEGAAAGYTCVSTVQELNNALQNNNSNTKILLMNDITLEGGSLSGSSDYYIENFYGELNGNGYTINTVYMLADHLQGATVKDLKLNKTGVPDLTYPEGTLAREANNSYLYNIKVDFVSVYDGGLIHSCYNSTVEAVSTSGTIINSSQSSEIGGIFGDFSSCVMKNCKSDVDIVGNGDAWAIGGLIGYSYASRVENCTFTGSLDVDSDDEYGCGYITGGIYEDTYENINYSPSSANMRGNVVTEGWCGYNDESYTPTNVNESSDFSLNLFVNNSSGNTIGTIKVSATTTIDGLLNELSTNYNISGYISDGVIHLNSSDGKTLSGEIANALGITAATSTIGLSKTSTAVVTYQTSYAVALTSTTPVTLTSTAYADGTTTLNDLGINPNSDFINTVNRLTQEEAIAQGYSLVTSATELINHINAHSRKIILMNDIDMRGHGTISDFSGELNGNGYTIVTDSQFIYGAAYSDIHDVCFDLDNTYRTYDAHGGVISTMSYSKISNVIIKNANLVNSSTLGAGILAGTAEYTSISAVKTSGSITAQEAGGIIAHGENVTITSCTSEATVQMYNESDTSGHYLGGLVSKIEGSNNYITDSIFTGQIRINNISYSPKLGFIAGSAQNTTITNAKYNTTECFTIANTHTQIDYHYGNETYDYAIGNYSPSGVTVSGTNSSYVPDVEGLAINDRNGNKTVLDITANTSLNDLITLLNNNGFEASLTEGVLTVSSTIGKYLIGTVANALGLTTETSDTEYTGIGKVCTSTAAVTYSSPEFVTTNTSMRKIGIDTYNTGSATNLMYYTPQLTQAQAEAQGYIWVTTKAELTAAMTNSTSNTKICLGNTASNMSLSGWESISSFKGELNGNGCRISNLDSALIENSNGATIKNLIIYNATIEQSGTSVGVLANSDTNSTFKNINVYNSKIIVDDAGNNQYVGLVVGDADGTHIEGVKSTVGSIYLNDTLMADDSSYWGGIAGRLSSGSIKNSYSTTTINIENTSNMVHAGGIAGYTHNSTLDNLYFGGKFMGGDSQQCYIGGIVGNHNYTTDITNSNFKSSVVFSTSNNNSGNCYICGNTSSYDSSCSITDGTNSVAKDFEIYNSSGSIAAAINVTSTTTLGAIITKLTEQGFDVTFENGTITAYSADGKYLKGNVAEQLNLTGGHTGGVTLSAEGQITASTKLADIGANGNYTVVQDGTDHIINLNNSSDTVGDLFAALAAYDISANIYNGKVTFTPAENAYVKSGKFAAFNIDPDAMYDTVYTKTQTSSVLESESEANITESTRVSDLGFNSRQYITVNGSTTVVTIETSDTIGDVFTKLAPAGIIGTIENGVVHLEPVGNANGGSGAIMWYEVTSSPLLQALHLAHDEDTYDGRHYENHTLTASTTLGELYLGNSRITIMESGTERTVTLRDEWTVGDMLTTLAGYGISGSVQYGRITFNPSGNSYITGMYNSLISRFNLGDNNWYNITTGAESSMTSGELGAIQNAQMTTATKLADIGITGEQSITVTHEGTLSTISFNTTTNPWYSVDDLLTTLAGYGISGSVQDGKLTIAGSNDNYIVNMSNLLKQKLKITDSTYETQEETIGHDLISNPLTKGSVTATMTSATTLQELGLTQGQTLGIATTAGSITVSSTSTVGDIIEALASRGIASNIQDGLLSIDGGGANYVRSIEPELASALHITSGGDGYSYQTATESYTINSASTSQCSDTVTLAADSATTLSEMYKQFYNQNYYSLQSSITVRDNEQTYTIAIQADETLGDMYTKLAAHGIQVEEIDYNDGKYRMNFYGSDHSFITGMSDNLKALFGNPQLDSYTTTTTTAYTNPTSGTKTLAHTMTTSSTMADLGLTGTTYITVNNNGTDYTVNVTTDDTVDDILTTLAGLGISGSVSDGQLTLQGSADGYIKGMTDTLAQKLKISSGASYSTQEIVTSGNTTSGILERNANVDLNLNSTFEKLGMATAGYISVIQNGTEYTLSIGVDQTVSDMFTQLASFGINGSINGGKVTLTGTDSGFIKNMSDNLKAALGLEVGENKTYRTSPVTTYENQVSNTRTNTVTQNMTTTSTMKDLGLNSTTSIVVNNNGTDYTVAVTTDKTVDDILTTLAGLGISGSVSNDGKLTLTGTSDSYIKSMTNTLANTLKVQLGSGKTYNSQEITTSGNTVSSHQDREISHNLNTSAKFSELGMNSAGTITVVENGTEHTINVNTANTVDDIISTLAGFGIAGSVSNDGRITFTGDNNSYIKGISDNVKTALKLDSGSGKTYNTHNTYTNTVSEKQDRDATFTLNSSSTMSDLGLNSPTYITVNKDGTDYTVTVTQDKTVDDIISTLAGLGISGAVTAGKLSLTGTDNAYIKEMTTELANALKIQVGNNKTYSSEEVTTSGNTISNHKQRTITSSVTTATTLEQLGLAQSGGVITVNYQGSNRVIAVTPNQTVDDLLTTLAGVGIQGSVQNGRITLTGGNDAFISGISDAVKNVIKIEAGNGKTHSSSTKTTYENTVSDDQHRDITYNINSDSLLSRLGLNNNATVTVVTSGTEHIVTVRPDMTIDDMFTTLAGYGISGSVQNGQVTFAADNNHYIKDMTAELKTALRVQAGQGNSWTTMDSPTWVNTDSNDLTMEKNNLKLTGDTLLSSISGWNNGNGKLAIHQTNGHMTTISIDQTKTLDQFFNQISEYGLVGSVDSDGKVTITGVGDVYLQNVTSGSNILTALKLSDINSNIRTLTTNSTSDELQHTVTVAATGTTQLQDVINESGLHITFDGSNNAKIVLQTTSDAGNSNVTLSFNKTDSIYDVIDRLAENSINATVDALGNFSINSSTLTDFDISGTLGTFLMGNYSKDFGTDTTYNVTTNLVKETVFNMDDSTELSNFGITNGNILITQDGVQYTVNIDTTAIQTVGDFRNLLSQYGFTTQIDNNGRLAITGVGNSRLDSIGGGSNILDKFGITTGWSRGEITQTSDVLTDIEVHNEKSSLDRKLSELTDSTGTNLGITSGSIYVYQNGTRSTFEINNDETIGTLAARLSQYGISAGLSSEGRLYFDGNNDSYLTTDGIYSGNASNILDRLNVEGGWSTRYDSTSNNLEYTEQSNQTSLRSTKLKDLQDSDGNNLGITNGTYYVYEDGVRNTETITEDMTVNDLMASMATYGLIADIAEDGSISVSGHKNSFMMTSSLMGANSNIVEALFNSEWDFTNVYTSNGLTAPEDVVQAITRDTHLSVLTSDTESYIPGNITVIKDGVQSNISLTTNDTVGTLMDELALYGFESVINDNGQLILKNTGDSKLMNYSGEGAASNALELLGIDLNSWVNTNTYDSSVLTTSTTTTVAATRDTALSELGIWENGDQITGEYNIYNNGVKFTAMISSDETIGSLIETLKSFGLEASLVENEDGSASTIKVNGRGNSYIAKSASVNKSDVVDRLFSGDVLQTNAYSGVEETKHKETVTITATETTLVKDLKSSETGFGEQLDGNIAITVNGVDSNINIDENDSLGNVLDKFRALGLEATISNGKILIQSGYDTVSINADASTSSLAKVNTPEIQSRLVFNSDLGGYMASESIVISTTQQTDNVSVSNFANDNTKLGLLNISSGTLTLYRNGQRATVQVDSEETFAQFRARVASAFSAGDINIKFSKTVNNIDGTTSNIEDGYLRFYTDTEDVSIEVGATTDTSNFSAITGVAKNSDGEVISARKLYCVNNDSKITSDGLFKRGKVTEGTFTIGTQVLTIDSNTTMSDIVSMINNNNDTNATAYWDNIKGELVISSRSTGSAYINIEAGTSNFTDIMGYTTSERNDDGSFKTERINGQDINKTRLNVETQTVGDNARFVINGTTFTSSSNTIASDVSRIKGVTLNLKNMSKGETVELKVERDKETLANAVSDIVDAYNELMKNVDEQIASDGKLKKETTLKLIRSQLRSLMTSSFGGGTVFKNLDSVGIGVSKASGGNISTTNADVVNLTFDKEKFLKAYASDQDALKTLLVGEDGTGGIFNQVETLVESTLQSTTGYFASAEKSYTDKINKLTQKITKGNQDVERYKARLENKFKSMDMLIAQINQQYSTFLQS